MMNRFREFIRIPWFGALAVSIILWLVGGVISGNLSLSFLAVNATLAGFLALAGVAQMTVMASGSGSFDLSLPYIVTFSAYVMSAGLAGHGNSTGGAVLSLAMGLGAGLLNAVLIGTFRIPPIVATLATGYILYSLIVAIQHADIVTAAGVFARIVRVQVDGFTGAFAIGILTLIAMAVLFKRTIYGRQLHAMGQNRDAAYLAGIRLGRMTMINFAISGIIAAWLGILLAIYQGGVSADLGTTYLLGSVAAVVVGGTSISGGRTSVIGTALGAFVLTLTLTDLTILHFSAGFQDVIEGLLVIATVCITRIPELKRRGFRPLSP